GDLSDTMGLSVCQCKPRRNVTILGTQHQHVAISTERKEKPETVEYYNHSKVARVDGPLLDLAAITAWVLRSCRSQNTPRRDSMLRLAHGLRAEWMASKAPPLADRPFSGAGAEERRRMACMVKAHCMQNKTLCKCVTCGDAVSQPPTKRPRRRSSVLAFLKKQAEKDEARDAALFEQNERLLKALNERILLIMSELSIGPQEVSGDREMGMRNRCSPTTTGLIVMRGVRVHDDLWELSSLAEGDIDTWAGCYPTSAGEGPAQVSLSSEEEPVPSTSSQPPTKRPRRRSSVLAFLKKQAEKDEARDAALFEQNERLLKALNEQNERILLIMSELSIGPQEVSGDREMGMRNRCSPTTTGLIVMRGVRVHAEASTSAAEASTSAAEASTSAGEGPAQVSLSSEEEPVPSTSSQPPTKRPRRRSSVLAFLKKQAEKDEARDAALFEQNERLLKALNEQNERILLIMSELSIGPQEVSGDREMGMRNRCSPTTTGLIVMRGVRVHEQILSGETVAYPVDAMGVDMLRMHMAMSLVTNSAAEASTSAAEASTSAGEGPAQVSLSSEEEPVPSTSSQPPTKRPRRRSSVLAFLKKQAEKDEARDAALFEQNERLLKALNEQNERILLIMSELVKNTNK
ncbi:hypothetical protein KUCAC02_031402, partial [Chaenocephalus aceratus]